MSALNAPPTHYWQCERWRHYAAALVRYHGRRSDFSVRLSKSIPTACVIPSRKQVIINPEWERTPNEHLSRVQVRGHDRLRLTLEGLAAHEAGHIRFSGDMPAGLLGQLWNALEDERLERLQCQDFGVARAFTFLGDYTLLSSAQDEGFFTAQAGVLLWRFQHDFSHSIWQTEDPRWKDVEPLVEEAWAASDSDDVIEIARKIMEILELPEDAPEDAWLAGAGLSAPGEALGEEEGHDQATADAPGQGVGTPPTPPEDDLEAFGDLAERLELARPLSRQLERILKAPRPAAKTVSRSRGRLNVRRVIRHEDRPFEKRVVSKAKPKRILIAQDISGSMGTFEPEHAHYHALLTSLAFEMACSRLGVKLALISFDDVSTLERPFSMPNNEALLKVSSLETRGGTTLCRALEHVVQEAQVGDLIFVLCDGMIAEQDVPLSRTLARRTAGTFVPILIGERAQPEQFEAVFGRTFRAEKVEDIPKVMKRALLALTVGAR